MQGPGLVAVGDVVRQVNHWCLRAAEKAVRGAKGVGHRLGDNRISTGEAGNPVKGVDAVFGEIQLQIAEGSLDAYPIAALLERAVLLLGPTSLR
jgi:hypothetical protein